MTFVRTRRLCIFIITSRSVASQFVSYSRDESSYVSKISWYGFATVHILNRKWKCAMRAIIITIIMSKILYSILFILYCTIDLTFMKLDECTRDIILIENCRIWVCYLSYTTYFGIVIRIFIHSIQTLKIKDKWDWKNIWIKWRVKSALRRPTRIFFFIIFNICWIRF